MRFPSLYKTAFSLFFFVSIISSLPSCHEPLLEDQLVGRWELRQHVGHAQGQYQSMVPKPFQFQLSLYPSGGLVYHPDSAQFCDFTSAFTVKFVGNNYVQFLADTLDPYLDYCWDFGNGNVSYNIHPGNQSFFPGITDTTVCLSVSNEICSTTYCVRIDMNTSTIEPLYTNVSDTGNYTLKAESSGRILTISGLAPSQFYLGVQQGGFLTLDGEYKIYFSDENNLWLNYPAGTFLFVRME